MKDFILFASGVGLVVGVFAIGYGLMLWRRL